MDNNKYDIIIIGSGPAGYVAAIKAAIEKQKVAIIEKEKLGGVCLNVGCIPTKSLLKSAEVFNLFKQAEKYGIKAENVKIDIKKIVQNAEDISAKLSKGISSLLKKHNIDIYHGIAKFESKNQIIVDQTSNQTNDEKKNILLEAKNIILALGAKPKEIPNFEFSKDKPYLWSYKDALKPKSLPKSIIIVGSGAIGVEFASFYNSLGSKTTLLEAQKEILPNEDEDIKIKARKMFEEQNINIITNIKLSDIKYNKSKKLASVTIETKKDNKNIKQILEAEIILMATGVKANIDNINLDKLSIKIEKDYIKTNQYMQTNIENIYAIGDVTNPPWLAHKAIYEAMIAIKHITSSKYIKSLDINNVPSCTYSFPEIASIGITEKQAIENNIEISVGKFPFYANGKALIDNNDQGFVKIIFEKQTREILGAHLIGKNVTELIYGISALKTVEAIDEDIINTIFPHPTLSESIHEAVLNASNKSIHI